MHFLIDKGLTTIKNLALMNTKTYALVYLFEQYSLLLCMSYDKMHLVLFVLHRCKKNKTRSFIYSNNIVYYCARALTKRILCCLCYTDVKKSRRVRIFTNNSSFRLMEYLNKEIICQFTNILNDV